MNERCPTALMTIRAWREDGSEPLRTEIRLTRDVSSGFQDTLSVAHTERVLETVRAFLEDVVSPLDA